MDVGPGLSRADRPRRRGASADLTRLLEDPEGLADAALALEHEERLALPALLVEDARAAGVDPRGALVRWIAREEDVLVARELLRQLSRTAPGARGYRQIREEETVLWLVRQPAGDALEVREQTVRYHASPAPLLDTSGDEAARVDEVPIAQIVDEAVSRLWAHRRRLPDAASRFASLFDPTFDSPDR